MNENNFGGDVRKSQFNEASLKMSRIHKLQDVINLCSLDKQGFFFGYPELGLYPSNKRNYEVIFECINQLLQEVWAKLNKQEQTEALLKREIITASLLKFPIYTHVKRQVENKSTTNFFKQDEWTIIERILTEYESHIRTLIDKHGFTGKEALDPSTAALE